MVSEEIVSRILSYLPVKSVLRFQLVSKLWLYLTRKPWFVDLQDQRLSLHYGHNFHLLLAAMHEDDRLPFLENGITIYSVEVDPTNQSATATHVLTVPRNYYYFETGCFGLQAANGLVCCYGIHDQLPGKDNVQQVHIVNPCTRQHITLPMSPPSRVRFGDGDSPSTISFVFSYGFGFDPRGKEYKVLQARSAYKFPGTELLSLDLHVFTLGSDEWREIHQSFPGTRREAYLYGLNGGMCLQGIFYALIYDCYQEKKCILAFDVGEETFTEIPLPQFLSPIYFRSPAFESCHQFRTLFEVQECVALLTKGVHNQLPSLCILRHGENHVWEMMEEEYVDCWGSNYDEALCTIPTTHELLISETFRKHSQSIIKLDLLDMHNRTPRKIEAALPLPEGLLRFPKLRCITRYDASIVPIPELSY